jgi:hypothetical protein
MRVKLAAKLCAYCVLFSGKPVTMPANVTNYYIHFSGLSFVGVLYDKIKYRHVLVGELKIIQLPPVCGHNYCLAHSCTLLIESTYVPWC